MKGSIQLIGGLTVVPDGTSGYRVDYDWAMDVEPSTVVVTAVAAVSGVDIEDLDPLHEVVDPDALDALFRPPVDGTPRNTGAVQFSFGGYDVTLRSEGAIVLRARSSSVDSS